MRFRRPRASGCPQGPETVTCLCGFSVDIAVTHGRPGRMPTRWYGKWDGFAIVRVCSSECLDLVEVRIPWAGRNPTEEEKAAAC